MNKRSTIVAVVLVFLVGLAGLRVMAQTESQSSLDPETQAQVQQRLQQISSELNLTDDQKQQLKPILQSEFQQLKSLNTDTTLSPEQKQAKAQELHQSAKSQMGGILTPEQQKKLAAMKEEER